MDLSDGGRRPRAVQPVSTVTPLRLFNEMLAGWSAQQTSRMLAAQTVETRSSQVRRFADFSGGQPWEYPYLGHHLPTAFSRHHSPALLRDFDHPTLPAL